MLMTAAPSRRPVPLWLVAAGALALVLVAYAPAWHGGFLWDDEGHVTRPALRGLAGLWKIWFRVGETQQYYPLTHSAFWLEYHLWGSSALGYRLVNIVEHAAAAALVAAILRSLSVRGWWLAAIVFALHPVQVESVAWISEQKNTLSGLFFLASILAYMAFDRGRAKAAYLLALGLFACALFSKSVTATLPVTAAALVWWRRGELNWSRDLRPLTPFLALGLAVGAATAWVEAHLIGASGAANDLSILERPLVAGRALWFYLVKAVWPAHLAFVYPRWTVDVSTWWQWLFPAAAVVVVFGLWRWRHRNRAPLAAAIVFAGTLGPALGFVNIYPFRFSFVADHFQYLAILGIIVPVTSWLVSRAERAGVAATTALTLAVVGVLGTLTLTHSASYVSAEELYRNTIRVNPGAVMARSNLAELLLERDTPASNREAVQQTRAALDAEPANIEARLNLALALERLDDPAAALTEFNAVIASQPAAAMSDSRLGILYHGAGRTLKALGRNAEAIARLRQAVEASPSKADAHTDLGTALAEAGQFDEARTHLEAGCRLNPRSAIAFNNFGAFLLQRGDTAAAIAALSEAVRLDATLEDARFNLALARRSGGLQIER